MWIPKVNPDHIDMFAYSADYLRVYKIDPISSSPLVDSILNKVSPFVRCSLQDTSPDRCSPVSSFDWNQINTYLVGAVSLDGICTLWNIETQQPISKLKAHTKEIYDIVFSSTNPSIFLTCGKDGSIRIFDMRQTCAVILNRTNEKYSTLYQTGNDCPILRLSWNPINATTVAFTTYNQNDISLVDMRQEDLLISIQKTTTVSSSSLSQGASECSIMVTSGFSIPCFRRRRQTGSSKSTE